MRSYSSRLGARALSSACALTTIAALRRWLDHLRDWQARDGRELSPGDFDAAFRALVEVMGDGWADGNPAGGGLDRLAEVVTRQ